MSLMFNVRAPNHLQASQQIETFLEKHFTKIALAISTLALAIFSPLKLILGIAIGFTYHRFFEPKLLPTDKIVTVTNTLLALIGSAAALLRLVPAGLAGGALFQAIPLLGGIGVGRTLYRAIP